MNLIDNIGNFRQIAKIALTFHIAAFPRKRPLKTSKVRNRHLKKPATIAVGNCSKSDFAYVKYQRYAFLYERLVKKRPLSCILFSSVSTLSPRAL